MIHRQVIFYELDNLSSDNSFSSSGTIVNEIVHFLFLKQAWTVNRQIARWIRGSKWSQFHDMYICLFILKKRRDNYFLTSPIISNAQRLNTYSKAIVQNFYRPSFVTVLSYSHFFPPLFATSSLSNGSISRSSTCLVSAFQFFLK